MEKKHNHGVCSNTDEVFKTFIGCRVKGMLHERRSGGTSAVVLVFDCGWGLAFNSNGSHWTETPDEVQRILRDSKTALTKNNEEIEHILKLAGE